MRRADKQRDANRRGEPVAKTRVKPNFKAMITVQVSKNTWIQVPEGTDPHKAKEKWLAKAAMALAAPRHLFLSLQGR